MDRVALSAAYAAIHAEATVLAGGLTDLPQRATVYHHLYQTSQGQHVFPLIAAHGALWAGRYFRFALGLGRVLAWQTPRNRRWRLERLTALEGFANAFRDINRRVCVDTYTNWHFTARFGQEPGVTELVPGDLLTALRQMHTAMAEGRTLTDAEKRAVFEAHFLHEQEHVVGPAITRAVAEFDWPLVRGIALRPWIRFAYFPRFRSFIFRDFSKKTERIEKGLRAFDWAAEVGWRHVEEQLADYRTLPVEFFRDTAGYFGRMRRATLAAAALG
jgi:hypothetical protein